MKRTFLAVRLIAVAGLLAAAATGCAKKVTSVDSSFTQVEGQPSSEVQLVLWPDLPVTLTQYAREQVPNSTPAEFLDIIQSETPAYAVGAGSQRLMIMDRTPASAFQMFRRESGGGYRQYQTFPLQAAHRWIDSQSDLYLTNDPAASGFAPPTYLARGLVEGAATTSSPLSNVATASLVPQPSMRYRGNLEPSDSLFTIAWDPVLGASGYWVHVYQFRANASRFERQVAGSPAPVLGGNVQDFLVAYVAAPDTAVKLPSDTTRTLPASVRLFTRRTTLMGQVYLTRVTAVDGNGQVIAYLRGERDSVRVADPNVFLRWTIGAVRVNPKRPTL